MVVVLFIELFDIKNDEFLSWQLSRTILYLRYI